MTKGDIVRFTLRLNKNTSKFLDNEAAKKLTTKNYLINELIRSHIEATKSKTWDKGKRALTPNPHPA